ncbi:MAG TPA: GatB/YqeY domain-containing protein [Polyangiaceae bacterium LLY-WYZ-14_1]|nr:GatB/YqeY domain-containing protein [Polyangiaceae bacterium LLY-WYZ-14_1]
MGALGSRIMDDIKQAMRDKDELARDTLRLLKSELGKAELDKGKPLSDDDELAVVAKAVKTRRETIAQYEEGGRGDAAETERREIEVLERYLPQPLSDDEARAAVQEAIAATGASSKADMGKVIGAVMGQHRGRIDGKRAKELAAELLG